MRLAAILLVMILAATSFAQQANVSVTMAGTYRQGEDGRVQLDLALEDPDGHVREGVWFLNVVEPLAGGEVRQVMHLLFDRATESGDPLRTVWSHERLTSGLSSAIDFRIGRRAPPGDYVLVVQLYSGSVTNSGRVRPQDRVAMEFFPLKVLPRTD